MLLHQSLHGRKVGGVVLQQRPLDDYFKQTSIAFGALCLFQQDVVSRLVVGLRLRQRIPLDRFLARDYEVKW
ncbi:MAG: hypothetical protein E6J43_01870 [Chloroflexi bacterium]|nr:MAG: hypothetical protein E6J43_01870 [Chloroflexota bacterium]